MCGRLWVCVWGWAVGIGVGMSVHVWECGWACVVANTHTHTHTHTEMHTHAHTQTRTQTHTQQEWRGKGGGPKVSVEHQSACADGDGSRVTVGPNRPLRSQFRHDCVDELQRQDLTRVRGPCVCWREGECENKGACILVHAYMLGYVRVRVYERDTVRACVRV